jgi:hypothetical protein
MSEILKYYSAFREKYFHSDRKSLFQNFIALFILQISNYALPLIVLPFLTRVLLPDGYGELAWSQYVVQFLIMITDFGFNFSATRQISIHQNDKEKIARIFTAVMVIKFLLLSFSCILVYAWIQMAEFDFYTSTLLWVSVLSAAGNVFFRPPHRRGRAVLPGTVRVPAAGRTLARAIERFRGSNRGAARLSALRCAKRFSAAHQQHVRPARLGACVPPTRPGFPIARSRAPTAPAARPR